MPAGKQPQGGAMLYGLITFVVLFLAATTFAVMFYLKLEDAKTTAQKEIQARKDVVNDMELRNIGTIVGSEVRGQSKLATMNSYLDQMYLMVAGQLPEEGKSAEAKVDEIRTKATLLYQQLYATNEEIKDENIQMLRMLEVLKSERDNATELVAKFSADVKEMQERWTLEVEGFKAAEEKLNTELEDFIAQADDALQSVDQMKESSQEAHERTVETFENKLAQKDENLSETQSKLDETKAMYEKSEETRLSLEAQLESIKPRPDIEVEAYKPDATVVSVDLQTKIVYLGIGSNDSVYRGLTFSIYDRSRPIPLDGKGKAEIKVFDVQPCVCAAKIVSMDPKNPVISDDIAVNLIWNSEAPNTFVVLGDFDFDGDGVIDSNGREKVIHLIESWGSIVADDVTINTDFVVAGNTPVRYPKPSDEDADVDPLAYEKYEESAKLYEDYRTLLTKAQKLSIPIFNTDRFKNLIGYETEAKMSSPK